MRVVQMEGFGGVEVLRLAERPSPRPGAGEARIRVRASGVNPADHKWRSGMFRSFAPVTLPHVLGYDVAGEIEALGEDAAGPAVGTRVVAMLDPGTKGGYAEQAVLPAAHAVPIPDRLDFATAAALPTAGLTGVQLVEDHARVVAGDTVLVTGATGSVGRFALHAAKAAGARVVAAVRAAQADEARAIGADAVLALGEEDWNGAPFDHLIDTVGGAAVAALARHLKPGATPLTVSTTPIPDEDLPIRPLFVMVRNDPARLARLLRSVAEGGLAVPVAHRLPLEQAAAAQTLVERGGIGGKVVLEP